MATPPDPRRSDAERRLASLARSAAEGDAEAFASLHARFTRGLTSHFDRKLAALGRGRREADSEDLAQATWIAFWEAQRAGRYDPARGGVSTFLYAVAHIVWLRYGRERGRDAARAAECPDEPTLESLCVADEAGLSELIEAARLMLSGGVSGLTDTDRQTLRAIAEGRSDREVASMSGASASTAHERKKAALRRFAEALTKRGFGPFFADTHRAPDGPEAKNRADHG